MSLESLPLDKLSPRELLALRARVDERIKTLAKASAPLAEGVVVELVALAVKQGAIRCRTFDGLPVTFRHGAGPQGVSEAHILTVRVHKSWAFKRTTFVTGELLGVRLDVAALGLVPLALRERGLWDPKRDFHEEGPGPRPPWLKAVRAAGPRPSFEMEQVLPGYDLEDPDSDPIGESVDLSESGDVAGALRVLYGCLEQDLRVLDAHAHLGNLLFGEGERTFLVERALGNYAAGVAIGDLSFAPGTDPVVPWVCLDNRPYLRCLHGLGLSRWALGDGAGAREVFGRMLRLNPNDNQGARFCLSELEAGRSYADADL